MSESVSKSALSALEAKRARLAVEDKKRASIVALRESFESEDFVLIQGSFYRKSMLVRLTFNDLSIHARFVGGDIVSITEEEVALLTS
jgi:hypothetical protein